MTEGDIIIVFSQYGEIVDRYVKQEDLTIYASLKVMKKAETAVISHEGGGKDENGNTIEDLGGTKTPDLRGRFILGAGIGKDEYNDDYIIATKLKTFLLYTTLKNLLVKYDIIYDPLNNNLNSYNYLKYNILI